MLDLTKYNIKFFDITMPDGEVLYLKAPSQGMVETATKLKDIDEKDIIDAMRKMCVDILNRNTKGKEYAIEDLEKLDYPILLLITNRYFKHWSEQVKKDVDFQ